MRFLQFDHPDGFHLFRSMSIYGVFEQTSNLLSDEQCAHHANQASPCSETTKHDGDNRAGNEKRHPNRAVAQRGHEHVKGGVRPLLVDEMKDSLIHATVQQRGLRSNGLLLMQTREMTKHQ